jgi:hypothetical protein
LQPASRVKTKQRNDRISGASNQLKQHARRSGYKEFKVTNILNMQLLFDSLMMIAGFPDDYDSIVG